MNKLKFLTIIGLSGAVGLAAACSSASNTTTTTATNANRATTNAANTAVAGNTTTAPKKDDEAPASVKAAFPEGTTFTMLHKEMPPVQVAEIEKAAGAKLPAADHHNFAAFSTAGGARKQIGAATVVKADGKDVVIVYENKEGSPAIKEVRSEGVPAPFLAQFAGKGHDDKFAVGGDIKANGADEATAKAIAQAVRIDSTTMQMLYGAAHSH